MCAPQAVVSEHGAEFVERPLWRDFCGETEGVCESCGVVGLRSLACTMYRYRRYGTDSSRNFLTPVGTATTVKSRFE